ncbi:MAG: hypothetical protein F6K36_04695 [Symploca sp. SIO3C6]|nr:hypothetical protein [Symploca sp. SIO3C6]
MTFGIGANRKDLVVFAVFCCYAMEEGEMGRWGDGEMGGEGDRIFMYILLFFPNTSYPFFPLLL